MTLSFTGAGQFGPLYLFCAAVDDTLIAADGYYSDTPIAKGARLTDGATYITVPFALEPGLFFEHDDEIGHKLGKPLVFPKELHEQRDSRPVDGE